MRVSVSVWVCASECGCVNWFLLLVVASGKNLLSAHNFFASMSNCQNTARFRSRYIIEKQTKRAGVGLWRGWGAGNTQRMKV